MFLHGLKQRRLRLWWRSVDFVGEEQVREDWPLGEGQLPSLGRIREDFCAGYIGGHQVWCELDALKIR